VITPAEATIAVGEKQEVEVNAVNQFGYAAESCRFTFRGTYVCDTTLVFTCHTMEVTATVHVLPYSAMNLALNKPVTASSYENAGTLPQGINDGDMTTRWGSAHKDNEWVEIDLEHCYLLDSVRLVWEAAYATVYDLMLSEDGDNYDITYTTADAKGGTQVIRLAEGSAGRYVRLLCKARSTGYGSSLYELEVYGSGRCYPDDEQTDVSNQKSDVRFQKSDVRKVIRNGRMYILRDEKIYTIMGQKVRF